MTVRTGAPSAASPRLNRVRLGSSIVADPVRHIIIRDGRAHAVEPRVMQLLGYFVARPGQLISKDELRKQVWGTHVVDEAVHRAISLLRSALGDTPRQSTIIETVPRHGYRLLVTPAAVDWTSTRPLKSGALRLAAAAAGVAALALLISPALRSGPADTPALPNVAVETAAIASTKPRQVSDAQRQPSPREIAAASTSPDTRPDTPLETTAVAPPAPAAASETRTPPALAPEAPAPRARQPVEAPAPRSNAPVAS